MYICMFIHTKGNAMCAAISEGSVSHMNVFGLCKKKRAVARRDTAYTHTISADDDDTLTSIV